MVLELQFDPSSKFLAAGTADSHVKVFDVIKGFQTHNFTGHRGIITNLTFYPDNESMVLVSSAEDCMIKVWDLVMRSEISTLRGHQALVTSIIFSNDKSTLITSSKDGKLGFWNIKDQYKLLSLFKFSENEEELNAIHYTLFANRPYLIVGGASGALSIFDINHSRICYSEHGQLVSTNEITKLIPLAKSNRLLALNADQQMTIYNYKSKSDQIKLQKQH
jgi:U3 small nucleolar RNA-associated protein 13